MKKSVLSIFITLCMLLSFVPTLAFADTVQLSGDGTEANPYIISNEAELFAFADIVNGTNGAVQNTAACAEVTNKIVSSVANGVKIKWTPMGSLSSPYMGTFTCNNDCSIEYMEINTPTKSQVGLFGCIENATIKNIILSCVYFEGDTDVGGIAGVAINSTVEDCRLMGRPVTQGDTIYGIYGLESVGGIVGRSVDSHIKNCGVYSYVQLRALSDSSEPARHKVGGIVGYALLTAAAASEEDAVLIEGCDSSHMVFCSTVNNYQCTGGIVGRVVSESERFRAVVKNCNMNGKADGSSKDGHVQSIESGTGGIAGYARNASIEYCKNAAKIFGTDVVGGIVGYAIHGTNIIGCTNYGEVVGMASCEGMDFNSCGIGGIAGSVYNSQGTAYIDYSNGDCDVADFEPISKETLIKNCTNYGNVTCNSIYEETPPQYVYKNADDSEPFLVAVTGAVTGGIAGCAVDSVAFSEEGNSVTFDNCKNTGTVTGSTYTGGLFGIAKNITTIECTNEGTVTNADVSDTDTITDKAGIEAFTVYFNAGTGSVSPKYTLAVNGKLESVPTPTKKGYIFEGWFTDEECSAENEFDSSKEITERTEIFAKWTVDPNYTEDDNSQMSEVVRWIYFIIDVMQLICEMLVALGIV